MSCTMVGLLYLKKPDSGHLYLRNGFPKQAFTVSAGSSRKFGIELWIRKPTQASKPSSSQK